jgi:hypothetical protein
MKKGTDVTLVLRASLGSHVAFCSVWLILAIGYGLLALSRRSVDLLVGALLPALITLSCIVWMRGHRISLVSGVLEYRDGFYRSRRIPVADIGSVSNTWPAVRILGRDIEVPRLSIATKDGAVVFQINSKPFSRRDLATIRNVLMQASAKETASSSRPVPPKGQG